MQIKLVVSLHVEVIKMTCSYIVTIDNTYFLTTNFVEQLLDFVADNDELIIVTDACNNIDTIDYLEKKTKENTHIKLIHLKHKIGFGGANNVGIKNASGETIIFINSDIFLEKNCIENMLSLLWSDEKIAAVQPLLIYPQNNLVQSTGHVFSDYRSGQLYSMRRPNDSIVQKNGKRQALTMALCAIKKDILTQIGGFDEYYFNSHEGLELTLKISLNGYYCFYCSNAIAYHCTGAARSTSLYDTSKQKAHFYQKWSSKIQYDVSEYLKQQIKADYQDTSFFILNFSTSHQWDEILINLHISILQHKIFQERFLKHINLFYCLPFSSLNYNGSFLFLCDNIAQLKGNYRWISLRKKHEDIIMDLDGNLVPLNYLIS